MGWNFKWPAFANWHLLLFNRPQERAATTERQCNYSSLVKVLYGVAAFELRCCILFFAAKYCAVQVCDARMLKRIGMAGLKIMFATLPSPKFL